MTTRSPAIPITVALGAVTLAFSASAATPSRGTCIVADTPVTVTLPDQSTEDAQTIKICHTMDYNPVAGLHTIYINGTFRGMFMSRRGLSEGRVKDALPYIQLLRLESGDLLLTGYAVPWGDRFETYQLKDFGPRKRRQARRNVDNDRALQNSEPVVLVAGYSR